MYNRANSYLSMITLNIETHRKLQRTVDRLIAKFEERIKTCELAAVLKKSHKSPERSEVGN
jgi:predicted component of type VI protein secretion system